MFVEYFVTISDEVSISLWTLCVRMFMSYMDIVCQSFVTCPTCQKKLCHFKLTGYLEDAGPCFLVIGTQRVLLNVHDRTSM